MAAAGPSRAVSVTPAIGGPVSIVAAASVGGSWDAGDKAFPTLRAPPAVAAIGAVRWRGRGASFGCNLIARNFCGALPCVGKPYIRSKRLYRRCSASSVGARVGTYKRDDYQAPAGLPYTHLYPRLAGRLARRHGGAPRSTALELTQASPDSGGLRRPILECCGVLRMPALVQISRTPLRIRTGSMTLVVARRICKRELEQAL